MGINNATMMWHPMRPHAHAFHVIRADGSRNARKHAVIVLAVQRLSVASAGDTLGIWMLHCHTTYHQEAGMMAGMKQGNKSLEFRSYAGGRHEMLNESEKDGVPTRR